MACKELLVELVRVALTEVWVVPETAPVRPVGSVGAGHEYLISVGTTSPFTPLVMGTGNVCPEQGVVNFGPITACPLA